MRPRKPRNPRPGPTARGGGRTFQAVSEGAGGFPDSRFWPNGKPGDGGFPVSGVWLIDSKLMAARTGNRGSPRFKFPIRVGRERALASGSPGRRRAGDFGRGRTFLRTWKPEAVGAWPAFTARAGLPAGDQVASGSESARGSGAPPRPGGATASGQGAQRTGRRAGSLGLAQPEAPFSGASQHLKAELRVITFKLVSRSINLS
jgi:hypothetical protein